MATQRHISLPKTLANGDVSEWFKRFEICCAANDWNDATKALKLPTLLEGEALAIWLELTAEQQGSYDDAKKEMIRKMAPQSFVSMSDFHRRGLHPGEPISVYVHELKKLLDQAMPELDKSAREQILLHQFIAGIPPHVSRAIRAAADVSSLEKAIERARLLMAVETPHTAAVSTDTTQSDLQELKGQISLLTEQVAALSASGQQRPQTRPKRCNNCGGIGHFWRNCPSPRVSGDSCTRRCYSCQKTGHLQKDCPESGNGQGMTVTGSRHPRNS